MCAHEAKFPFSCCGWHTGPQASLGVLSPYPAGQDEGCCCIKNMIFAWLLSFFVEKLHVLLFQH